MYKEKSAQIRSKASMVYENFKVHKLTQSASSVC